MAEARLSITSMAAQGGLVPIGNTGSAIAYGNIVSGDLIQIFPEISFGANIGNHLFKMTDTVYVSFLYLLPPTLQVTFYTLSNPTARLSSLTEYPNKGFTNPGFNADSIRVTQYSATEFCVLFLSNSGGAPVARCFRVDPKAHTITALGSGISLSSDCSYLNEVFTLSNGDVIAWFGNSSNTASRFTRLKATGDTLAVVSSDLVLGSLQNQCIKVSTDKYFIGGVDKLLLMDFTSAFASIQFNFVNDGHPSFSFNSNGAVVSHAMLGVASLLLIPTPEGIQLYAIDYAGNNLLSRAVFTENKCSVNCKLLEYPFLDNTFLHMYYYTDGISQFLDCTIITIGTFVTISKKTFTGLPLYTTRYDNYVPFTHKNLPLYIKPIGLAEFASLVIRQVELGLVSGIATGGAEENKIATFVYPH